MSTSLQADVRAETKPDDDIIHLFCCAECPPRTALCGTDLGDVELLPDTTPVDCVVCADLDRTPWCPHFGTCAEEAP